MRAAIIFLLAVYPFISFSQVNQLDSEGRRVGVWQKNYPNGRLMYEGEYKNGKPWGEWVRYYETGQKKAVMNYFGNDSVLAKMYDVNGKRVAEGLYVNEKKEGVWSLFSENIKISEEEYVNGKKCGLSKRFYPSGEIFEEIEWVDNKQEGKYQAFFKKGKPYLQCKFSNNKRNGLCLVFYENGKLEMEGFYKDNLRDKEWKYYDSNGAFLYSLEYDNGKLLNHELRDSLDNLQMKELDKQKNLGIDPEKFIRDPMEYLNIIQKKH